MTDLARPNRPDRWFSLLCWPLVIVGVVSLGLLTPSMQPVQAGPEPEAVPSRWELTVTPGPLRVIAVELPSGEVEPFYVFTYEVVNNSGEDLFFAPWFDLVTEEGEVARAGRGVSGDAQRVIHAHLGGSEELLSTIDVQGRMLQGEEHGRTGYAVWPATDLNNDSIKIFLMGFSGETRRVVRPDTGEEVVLRKSLMLTHSTPGELDPTSEDAIARIAERWVLR